MEGAKSHLHVWIVDMAELVGKGIVLSSVHPVASTVQYQTFTVYMGKFTML